MPIKDPTSDMAIISRKGSTLVREVHEKQSMNKSRQRFWELAGSKLGDILGVEKTAEQVKQITVILCCVYISLFKLWYGFHIEHVSSQEACICSCIMSVFRNIRIWLSRHGF